MKKPNYPLGAHLSISGGIDKSLIRALELSCTCLQIFTHSNRNWNFKKLTEEEVEKFKTLKKENNIKPVVSHASYLINLASPKKDTLDTSIWGLQEELKRCETLDIPYLVIHPGAHTGSGAEKGIETIANSINIALENVPGKTMILLENMAGQGSTIGSTFQELAAIYSAIKNKKRIGFCFDTCHAWSAGYDFSTPEKYTQLWQNFRSCLDLKKLKVIHLNNSKTKLGSHVDRHAGIDEGLMPQECFSLIMNDENFFDVAKIIETPKSKDITLDQKNLNILRSMITSKTKKHFEKI